MRPKGSPAALQARRLHAGQLLMDGNTVEEVAEIVGASASSVRRWRRAVEKGGLEALIAKPHPGRKPRLNAKQKQRLMDILLAGPLKSGYDTHLWTCRRVADVVANKFHVQYHPDHVGKLLHDLGWTCQKPEQRAREGDDEQLERWRTQAWPRIKRGPSIVAAP